jgi:beta-glucosidase
MLGLFENPYVDESLAEKVVQCQEHLQLAEEIARETFVLLKNKDNLLPLSKDLDTVALIGPCAEEAMFGDYAPKHGHGVSILEGIREGVYISDHCPITLELELT